MISELNDAPITIPTAISIIFPLTANSLNSLKFSYLILSKINVCFEIMEVLQL